MAKKWVNLTEGKIRKGGVNTPNMSEARPPKPGGSAGSRWYSPKDRTPEEGEAVEWMDSSGQDSRGTYSGGLWFLEGGTYIYYTPTLWRPLPD